MKTHLITGGGSGIGAAITDALFARGDQLVLLARAESRAYEMRKRWPNSMTVVADLADPNEVADLLAAADLPERLDSVVHSAGVGALSTVSEADPRQWTSVLAINLVSPAVLTRACLSPLRRAGGTVVFINSGAGLNAGPGWSPYSASK